jgi:tetratricopeptide (TPR) repeat protein
VQKIKSLFGHQFFVYLIAMDLSYKNGKYDQVMELYDLYLQNNPANQNPRDLITIVFATYKKQNTAESYEKAKTLLQKLTSEPLSKSRKSIVMFSSLALQQGHLHEALESLISCNKYYFVAKNLRILILSKLGRFDEVLSDLTSIISYEGNQKDVVLKEVVSTFLLT